MIGAREKRTEDLRLTTGEGTYVDDIQLPGMLHLDLVRSTVANARILEVDTSGALDVPGAVAAYTARDLHGLVPAVPGPAGMPGMEPRLVGHHVLADEHVRFVGEAVAAVVAADRYAARDARDAIFVDYEGLPAIADLERALEPDAPLVHPELGSNLCFELTLGNETEAALAESDVVVQQRMVNQRVIPNPMETRGLVVDYRKSDGRITLWTSTQAPHLIRSQLAEVLGLPEHMLRVIAPEVGGAFGCKNALYPEEMLAVALARQLRRPVKWVEERQEHMLATTHGRGQVTDVTLGARSDGTLRALHLRIRTDLGAHPHGTSLLAPLQTAALMTGCYRIPHARADIQGVYTNTTSTEAYRGFGRSEAAYYIERAMDLLARRLDLDPIELRRRNFVRPDEFPYAVPTYHVFDSGNYELCLDRALEKLDLGALRDQQERLRADGRYLGIGFATYAYRASISSLPRPPGDTLYLRGMWEYASVRADPMGGITLLTGTSCHGQGLETSLAQIAADALGIGVEGVTVLHRDTDVVPYGQGTMGSRSLAIGGSAVLLACKELREQAIRLAAHRFGVEVDAVRYGAGRAFAADAPDEGLTLAQLSDISFWPLDLPDGMSPRLEGSATFAPPNFTTPFGTHVCVVEVDPQTGEIEILRYVAVDDCGRAVNPMIIEGQIHGGIAQGLGQALLERVVYDEEGQPLSASFLSYATPKADDMPNIETELTETPSAMNPLGARGIGESGTCGAAPAIVNAVVDALAPLGVEHLDMPLLPEKLWRVLQKEGGAG
ncbi:MAG: xanthine dehydrogenase family protein [Deltaproteobacteria bacterium]|nr:xanthine dehydrogenase family protein [Deltaproteobacteria bacterium]MBW2417847.1 xanthine dehydrogenase family protein [Deltaproteobacteria bacterium]